MDHGKVIEQGPPAKLFNKPQSLRLREFLDTWRSRNMLFQTEQATAGEQSQ
jgi:polar amino acid transport system ATP-binding protein